MSTLKSSRIHPPYKTKYRVRNWREYERGLRSRGDVTVWFNEDAIAAWISPGNRRRGGQQRYSDRAIETALTLRAVFGSVANNPDQPVWYHQRHDMSGSGGNVIDFKGRHFEQEMILQSDRWYLTYSLQNS